MNITFAANAESNPLNAMAADFWAGEVTLQRAYGDRWTATVKFSHTQALLCARYGFNIPHALRLAQQSAGYPVLPTPFCRDCNLELVLKPQPFPSRQAFIDFAQQTWANAFCGTCDAKRNEEQARIRHEREQQRLEQDAQRKQAMTAKREKLRERFGEQYLKDCPSCFGVLYLRKGRYVGSMFIACSSYPDCRHREPMLAPVPAPDLAEIHKVKAELANARPCPKCESGRLRQVKGAYGLFVGCTAYPVCKFTESVPQPAPADEKVIGIFE
jgi:ssDNA-binding Zn-finger/Zn-ribbon topoisomerase 1